MPSRPHPAVLVAGLAAVGLLSACNPGTHSTAATSLPPGAPPSTEATTTTSSTASSASTSTSSTAPATSSGALPAVQNASDIKATPVIQPTTAPAPTTLQVKDLVVGNGAAATANSTVTVNYVGALYPSAQIFDASSQHGGPQQFSLAQVVPGFQQGIAGMKVGGRREIVIPPALGYGSQAQGPIPANSTLTFVVDLVAVS